MTARLACVMLVAACGSSHHTVDANRDTSTDTLSQPTGDAPPGATTLTVTVAGMPAANVPVYFQNADSTLVLGAITDAHGTVGAMLVTGGFVTAIEPADGSGVVKLSTFSGVAAGEALHLDLSPLPSTAGTFTTLKVQTDGSASAYKIESQCGEVFVDGSGMSDVAFQGCGNLADIVVIDLDIDGNSLGAYYRKDAAVGPAPTDAAGF